jgi:hypothetical protein
LTQLTTVRNATVGMMVLSAIFVTLFGYSAPQLQQLSLLCAAASFCTNGGVVGLYGVFARAFPTSVRATGTGFAVGLGRGGSVLAPIVAGILFNRGYGLSAVAMIMATGSALAAVVLLLSQVQPPSRSEEIPVTTRPSYLSERRPAG